MKESEFLRQILQAFQDDPNVKMFRRNVGMMKNDKGRPVRFGKVGMSDLFGWIDEHRCPFCNRRQFGTHFEIEVKNEKGKLTESQRDWLEFVAEHCGIALEVHPEPNDPIGLRERILKMLVGQKCPVCVEKETL